MIRDSTETKMSTTMLKKIDVQGYSIFFPLN